MACVELLCKGPGVAGREELVRVIEELIQDPTAPDDEYDGACVDTSNPPVVTVITLGGKTASRSEVVLVRLGTRYNLYCAGVARSYMLNPGRKLADEYAALLAAHTAAVESLVEGAPLSAPYNAAVAALQVFPSWPRSDERFCGFLVLNQGVDGY